MIARSMLAVLAAGSLAAFLPVGTDGPATELAQIREVPVLDLEGHQQALGKLLGDSVVVLAYTGVACPIGGKYAPRLTRLSREYADRNVRFLGVNANPQDSCADVAKDVEELGIEFPVVKDFRQILTRKLDVETSTEVFLFDGKGELRYHGAVDDQYSLGAAKPEPTKNYLIDALEAVLAGKEPATKETEAPGCIITRLKPEELPEPITWSGDVAGIIQRNCEACHRPGQVGPFPLQTYEQARGWAEMIGSVVEEGRMPPWNLDEKYHGVFANERRLKAKDKAKLLTWIEDGMPRGNPDEDPAPAKWPEGWSIGEPDAVFTMEKFFDPYTRETEAIAEAGYAVPREGTVEYQYFFVDTGFTEDRWIQAMEVKPGAADVVHHVLIVAQEGGLRGLRQVEDSFGYLAVAVPGDTPSVYPEGYAKKLPANSTLLFQLHYTPNGKERFDKSSIAMVFAEEPPIFEVVTHAVYQQTLRIPPGDPDFEVRATDLLMEDTGIVSFFPHMHTRGKDFKYVAHLPDGSSEELLFSNYDFNWQESYVLPDPLLLPAGTKLEVVGHFDNSAGNPNNPDPEKWVTWGDQSWEEMFIGYYDHVVPLDE